MRTGRRVDRFRQSCQRGGGAAARQWPGSHLAALNFGGTQDGSHGEGRCPRVGLVGRCFHVRMPFSMIHLLTSIARKAIIRQTKWGCAWE